MEQKTKAPESEEKRHDNAYSEKALRTLWLLILAGVIGVVLFALQARNLQEFFSITAVGVMVSGAALLIGGFLGFLFGIPRTLQQERPIEMPGGPVGFRQEGGDQSASYRANTNLEQISDWLTKILVGVGLTQLNRIPTALAQVGQSVSAGFGQNNITPVFVLSTILYFLICGFLFGYLWTRLFLPGAFRQADLSALANEVREARIDAEQAKSKVKELENQMDLDGRALALCLQQLNSGKDVPPPAQEELYKSVEMASGPARLDIFSKAHNLRSESLKGDKRKILSTIPIFRALIECDADSPRHRNHAQLAYALKDMPGPDLKQAELEITRAIEKRDAAGDRGWLFYEFNRAICRIRQDAAFETKKASSREVREKILIDLQAAAKDDYIYNEAILKNDELQEWMSLNKATDKDLR